MSNVLTFPELKNLDERFAAVAADLDRLERRPTAEVVAIGNRLHALKEDCGHGHWQDKCKEHHIPRSTAIRFMNVAEEVGENVKLSFLSPDSILRLRRARNRPEHQVAYAAIMARIEAGEQPTGREIEDRLDDGGAKSASAKFFDGQIDCDPASAGKNFSCNNLGQRKKSDFYETTYSITQHLLDNEPFDHNLSVCEPACGGRAIVRVLENVWDKSLITSYDKDRDFLKDTQQYHYIITNPPFSLAYEYILHAKELAKEKFAFLLPLSYLHGKKRYDGIYQDKTYGLSKVYVFTQYSLLGDLLREDGKYRTGMMVYAWYVFENHYDDLSRISWLDNNGDVLSGRSVPSLVPEYEKE